MFPVEWAISDLGTGKTFLVNIIKVDERREGGLG